MIKELLFGSTFVCLTLHVSAQTNHYRFEVDTDAYSELTGDIALTQMVFATGDPIEVKDLFGETFSYFNEQWLMDTTTTGVLIFPNAFVEVVKDNNFIICDGLLRWLDSIDNTSKISYKIEGAPGSKILKVQWKNLMLRTGQPGNFVNLQIWLHQNGIIEYRYGPMSASNASGYTQQTGPSVGISYSPFDLSPIFEKIWIYGTPPNITIDSARNMNFPNIWGVPVDGTVYRFAPKMLSASTIENNNNFDVYPNPANTELHIHAAITNTPLKATLFDLQGRVSAEYLLDGHTQIHTITTGDLPGGIYELRLQTKQQTITQKIEIKH
ncbi:MAG TPA: T9SS type A sorting domain-containing protein [Flavipsychrobacter sp.]|nr:T9SS type A sorting domain-containing protein [Flavipsychrobacter sp.]